MAFEHYIRAGQKTLRCGYTTGTCAALAAAGAAQLLLTGRLAGALRLVTPKGWPVEAEPLEVQSGPGWASCAVRKDSGDDPDITGGTLIFARVERAESGLTLRGGTGIGRVTKPGLDQPVGEWAINRVPREMIHRALEEVSARAGYTGGLLVTLSAPEGEALAARTFNPLLGIEGGISILGTSGVVEPMSEQALVETLNVQLRQAAAESRELILTPGNYGMDFLESRGWSSLRVPVVKCSNYIGEALDGAAACGFERLLLVGHAGKLCKLAAGIMNTHSRMADGRGEVFTAHAAMAGADAALCRALMDCATSDACVALLRDAGLDGPVLESITRRAAEHLCRRVPGIKAGLVIFSNQYGLLGQTETAKELLDRWRQ